MTHAPERGPGQFGSRLGPASFSVTTSCWIRADPTWARFPLTLHALRGKGNDSRGTLPWRGSCLAFRSRKPSSASRAGPSAHARRLGRRHGVGQPRLLEAPPWAPPGVPVEEHQRGPGSHPCHVRARPARPRLTSSHAVSPPSSSRCYPRPPDAPSITHGGAGLKREWARCSAAP